MQSLKREGIEIARIDVTDDSSMSEAVKSVIEKEGRIDVLMNNAGYGSYGSVEDVPMEEAWRQLEVNVIGAALILLGFFKSLLLRADHSFKHILFDFVDGYRIDLETFMTDHLTYRASIEQFARMSGRSLSTFKRDFKKIFNDTPERWLRRMRLEESWSLLKEKGVKPGDAGKSAGFSSLSHFSTAFKSRFGKTPSQVYKK